uniref:(northern house mosquito) hypothetical protein n=1 Tax=Culex pipiens TaxID=7175 RepID=A0A8D8EY50_CULPI
MQHFVEEFVLLLLVLVQHVVRGWCLGRHVWRGAALLVFGDLREQLLERFLLLVQVGGHWAVAGAVTFGGRGYQPGDWRIHRSVVSADAPRASVRIVLATESRLQLFNAVDLADVRRNRATTRNAEQLL